MNSWQTLSTRYLRQACFLLAAVYAVNFFLLAFIIGPFDYDHLSGYYELAYRFWRGNFSLPHFNPYLCGGRTLGGDPQLPIFHPLVALVPILGPTILLKWEMLAALALGTWSLWKLLGRFGVAEAGQLWGILLFLGGGAVVARFMVGHSTLSFYFLYPTFFHLSYRIDEEKRWLRPFIPYAALFIYSGLYKPNFLIYGVPPLFIEAAARAFLKRRPRILLTFVAALGIGTLIDAVTYLPAWKYFSDFPRVKESEALFLPPYSLLANLLLPLKAVPEAWYGSAFRQRHEYSVFLGPLALWFAWLGWKTRATARPELVALAIFGVFSAWIGFGSLGEDFSPFFPFTWFREVWPGFRSIRVPTRFWFGAGLALLIFSAKGFRVPTTFGKWQLLLWIGLLPLILSATVNLFKTTVLAHGTQFSPSRAYPNAIEHVVNEHPDVSYHLLRQGKGVLNCSENMEVLQAKLVEGDALGVSTQQLALVKAQWIDWHRIRVKGAGESRLTLKLNLNHHEYWRFEGKDGEIISKRGEPLQLASPSGDLEGELVFEQPLAKEAAWISLVSLLLFVGLAVIVKPWARGQNDSTASV